jgi:hypothetical protein
MRHPVYIVDYSVVPSNSSLLTLMLHSSVRITLVYNETQYLFKLLNLAFLVRTTRCNIEKFYMVLPLR